MKMRLKEEMILIVHESYLGLRGEMLLRAGDVFEVTEVNGGRKLERDGMRIFAPEGFGTFLLEEVKE